MRKASVKDSFRDCDTYVMLRVRFSVKVRFKVDVISVRVRVGVKVVQR